MPRNPTTGVFTRLSNSFSSPIDGTIIDPTDAIAYYADIDLGITNALPVEPIIITVDGSIAAKTAAVSVQKTSPTTTALALPSVANQNGVPLTVFDWSTSVTGHTITLTPSGTETIMRAATWDIYSNSAQLGSLTLYPSTTLNGWYI